MKDQWVVDQRDNKEYTYQKMEVGQSVIKVTMSTDDSYQALTTGQSGTGLVRNGTLEYSVILPGQGEAGRLIIFTKKS